jgi:hypothetical protein
MKCYMVKEEGNNPDTVKIKKTNWIGHVSRRNCLLMQVTEGIAKVEMTGRHGRRRRQLLDDLKETRGRWGLKEEALDRTV